MEFLSIVLRVFVAKNIHPIFIVCYFMSQNKDPKQTKDQNDLKKILGDHFKDFMNFLLLAGDLSQLISLVVRETIKLPIASREASTSLICSNASSKTFNSFGKLLVELISFLNLFFFS